MTDKERILTDIAKKFIMELSIVPQANVRMAFTTRANPGDVIMSASTIKPHDFTFGYFVEQCSDHYKIRELTSDRVCEMYNDTYYIIPSDWIFPMSMLYGKEQIMLEKVEKAMRNLPWGQRFAGVEFRDNICIAKVRKIFSNDILADAEILYNSKTTIKSIWQSIDSALKREVHNELD